MIEWFGTAMSVIVALSLMQKKIKTLRIINLIGAVGFASYGLLIKAWPVLGLNAFIALVDIYYLTEIVRSQDFFSYISGKLDNSKYCQRFIEFYRDDMESYFPGQLQIKGLKYCLILRNMIPVSIILLQEHSSDEAEIVVDYATPSYRDLRNAQFFLHEIIPLSEEFPYSRIKTKAHNPKHERFLKKLGYQEQGEYFIWPVPGNTKNLLPS